jgi:predicted phage terminase large subunit-like protein
MPSSEPSLRPPQKRSLNLKARQILASRHLLDFLELDGAGRWQRANHLERLCSKLEELEGAARGEGGCDRAIFCLPPRGGKSEVCSKKFPAWCLGRNPDFEIILSTYAADLSYDFSRIARSTLREWGKPLWDVAVSEESSSVSKWGISGYRGGLTAAGVGGPITGRGAAIAIIDDPVKNAEEAASKVIQDKIWDWYRSTLYTRLAPDSAVVVIMTRWAEDDLVGRLVAEMETADGEDWEVLSIPALAEPGDPLGRKIGESYWPERFPVDWLQRRQVVVGPFYWEALYQQHPLDAAGKIFNPDLMHKINPAEVDLKACKAFGALDPSEGGADYAGLITVLVLPDGRWLVWDCDLSVDNQDKSISKIIEKQAQYRYLLFRIESNSLGHAKSAPGDSLFVLDLKRRQKDEGVIVPFDLVWNTAPKVDRIRSLQPHYANGQLCFRSDWPSVYPELIAQLKAAPNPKAHDDGPDSLEICVAGILTYREPVSRLSFVGATKKPAWK